VAHFNDLKLCPKNICLDEEQPSQAETAPSTPDVQQAAETVPFGHNLQLVDGDDDLDEMHITCLAQNDGSELASATVVVSTCKY